MKPLIVMSIVLLITWGVSAAALRLACNKCGESDASSGRVVGISFAHLAGVVLLGLVMSGFDGAIRFIINLPVGCVILSVGSVISAVLVRFILPTSTERAAKIAVFHILVTSAVMFVVFIAFGIAIFVKLWRFWGGA